jgi:ribosomal RNA-processing protein 12
MIIDDGDEANGEKMEVEEDVVGTAYRDSIRSIDGFSRGPNGRVKFNKDTKKRRREELEGETEDVEMGDVAANAGRRNKKHSPEKLGKEFRSKVRASNHTHDIIDRVAD